MKEVGGHLIVQVKDNQKYLQEKLRKASRAVKPIDSITTVEKNRNRIETRTVKIFDIQHHIKNSKNWDGWDPYIVGVALIDRTTEVFNHITKTWQATQEQSIYATSYIGPIDDIALRIRRHWGIESNNYVRDETMFEDYSRIRKNPQVFAILKSWTLNILRTNGENNIRSALYRNCCSFNRVLKYFKT